MTSSAARPVPDVQGLYIVENEPLERLLFDRNAIEGAFKKACLEASVSMLRHLRDELPPTRVSELVLLSKGLVYQLQAAYEVVIGQNLAVDLAATRRLAVEGRTVSVDIPYLRCESRSDTLLIGDTVASGESVVAALNAYKVIHRLNRVFLVSYAGSLAGARHIRRFCDDNRIELTMVFGLAGFGVGENGFDLSFLHEKTVTDERYRTRARDQFDGKPVSAVGWDFGSQWTAPDKYRELCWMEAEAWGLLGHPSLACARKPGNMKFLAAEAAAFLADTAGTYPGATHETPPRPRRR
jgi:hypothetical protein